MEGLAAAAGSLPHRIADGHVLVRQGEESRVLYLVLDGAVRLSTVLRSGKEVVLGLLGQGDLFGEWAVLPEPVSPVEARAVGRATVLPVPAQALDAVLGRQPATAGQVIRMLAARLHRTTSVLEDALARDVRSRVSRCLRELASQHGVREPDGVHVRLPITQEDLGKMAGASRESVNRTIGALAARGLVRQVGRGYVILDPDALMGVHDARG